MNTIEYKGYMAKIEYDAEDQVLYGSTIALSDQLVFECESLTDVEKIFHTVIDDYLELCAEIGKDPERTFKGAFNVRIPPELHRELYLLASKEGIPLNQAIIDAVTMYCDPETKNKPKTVYIYITEKPFRIFYDEEPLLDLRKYGESKKVGAI